MAQLETLRRRKVAGRRFANLRRYTSRAVALPIAGAVIGLGVATFNFLGPATPPVTKVPAGYAALVNQRPILMDDFVGETETTQNMPFDKTTPEQRRTVLRGMIDEELLVQRALAIDLPEQDTDVRKELADGVAAVVLAKKTPSDKELLDYFNAHRANYSGDGHMRFHDLVLHVGGFENADQTVDQAEADAHEAVYQLRSGASIDYVMQHFGLVNSGHTDGQDDLDFAVKLHIGAKLFDVASQLMDGEVSEPVTENDGVHILVMEERKAPIPADFNEARARVYADYRQAQQAKAEQDNLKFLRGNAQILLAPGLSE